MKKKILIAILTLITACQLLWAEEPPVGEETVEPVFYPKFFLSGDYNVGRNYHGFMDAALRQKLDNMLSARIGFEAGLYKYFNAGAFLESDIPLEFRKLQPIRLRLSMFAKPQIPLGDRFAIFSRIGAGLSTDFLSMHSYLAFHKDVKKAINKNYGGAIYSLFSYGCHASASVGIEYFFLSRIGLSIEAGVRVDVMRSEKSEGAMEFLGGNINDANFRNAPQYFNYMTYEFPILASLLIVL